MGQKNKTKYESPEGEFLKLDLATLIATSTYSEAEKVNELFEYEW